MMRILLIATLVLVGCTQPQRNHHMSPRTTECSLLYTSMDGDHARLEERIREVQDALEEIQREPAYE